MTKSPDKIQAIESISKFELFSIVYLCQCLTDNALEVRYSAYQKLRSANLDSKILSDRQIELINLGVLLNPNDAVWSVYQSGMTYTDDEYIIYDLTDDSGNQHYGRDIDISQYDLWNRGVACKLISTHVDRESAENAANQIIKCLLAEKDYFSLYSYCPCLESKMSQQDIYDRANKYQVLDLPLPPEPEPFEWNDSLIYADDNEDYRYELLRYYDRLREYTINIIEKLNFEEHYELIEYIYSNFAGRLAYVCKETVRETTYFIP
jgi:hypothetical protein